jgi:peptide/nickel transport system permease protein
MVKYIFRRTLYMIPILFGITLITFVLFNVAGGDPATQRAGRHASAEQIETIRKELGLDRSLPMQYLFFVKQIATMDFGRSWSTQQSVGNMILEGLGPSLCLAVPGFLITLLITVSISLFLARYRGSTGDRATMVAALACESISSLVFILALQYTLAYSLGWFPISGWEDGWLERWFYLELPILIYVVVSLGSNILFYRTIFIDEMYQDYVRTARAKGLPEGRILFLHILRNALIPIITIVVLTIPSLMLGSLLAENFFGIPGLGNMLVLAINNSDFPVIKAMTVIGAILYMVFQLFSDVLYAVVDPKVQLR